MLQAAHRRGRKLRVLFLCTGNSCRSQIAEAWARALHDGLIEAHSAGTEPARRLDPRAVLAMAEAGIDLASHRSKHVRDVAPPGFDFVITVCDQAAEACPSVPGGAPAIHAPFDDPPRLARGARSDDEAMPHYRRVRDEIRSFIQHLPAALGAHAGVRTAQHPPRSERTTTRRNQP